MAQSKIHVHKGDTVAVISGKDKGKRGKVVNVLPDKNRVVVEGVNVAKKHQKPTQKVMQGGIVDKEMPLAASNVALVCPKCNEPTRLGSKILESGQSVRVCKRCGETIDR
ncbi:MAG TPA: 50S ribosomal protein L24 [Bacillota bacterium]|jgi:large subunit ribosomal protein L24